MAITQISRITHRKGLNENLPQLAGAELGWALDQRKLYIGNGKTSEGAPTIGNTEILTEYSDILGITAGYTYKGASAGYTVLTGTDANNPTTRTLQSKFDDFASVKDFGAVGDGVTDDTLAIERAFYELFTRQANNEVRRSLFFPAGKYLVTNTIKIPAFAKVYGEGASSSVLYYSTSGSPDDYAFRTSDSKNQVGVNIENNGATVPTDIQITNLGFETANNNDVMLIESTTDSTFEDVLFKGPYLTSNILSSNDKACVRIVGTTLLEPKNVTFNNIITQGTTFGIYSTYNCKGITVSNSKINIHNRGIVLGESPLPAGHTGPEGFRIQQCLFDDIYTKGIEMTGVSRNISAYNIFLDVGNWFGATPRSSIIEIFASDNVSIGDLFERDDADNKVYKRINLNEYKSIGFDGSNQIQLGTFAKDVGKLYTLVDNTSSAATIFTFALDDDTHTSEDIASFRVKYSIKRNNTFRQGIIEIVSAGSGTLTYSDSYNENTSTGITLSVTQSTNDVSVKYVTTSTGNNATMSYTIERLY